MKITPKSIVGMIISLVMIVVLFNMLPSILPTTIEATGDLFGTAVLGNSTLVGEAPAAFASNVNTYLGWFWVLGLFVLILGTILALFLKRGSR